MSLRIYLVGRPSLDVEALHSFLRDQRTSWKHTPGATEAEELAEVSGRICYMSFGEQQSPKNNAEYIGNLIRLGHESVLEHVAWTFLLTGVSRAFTHQLVRHRVGFAFSQLSQQYHDETEADFVEPPELERFPEALEAWRAAMAAAKQAYRTISEALNQIERDPAWKGLRKEARRAIRSAARSVLPNATETKIVVTANARALRHFLKVRGSIPGDLEMRQVAAGLLEHLALEAPALFADFSTERLQDGSPIIVHHGTAVGVWEASLASR
jgi:thymidylate synthase (FAD)